MRILLVDDSADIRALLTTALREACYAIDTATNGKEGSYLARTNHYDAIIMDQVMPQQDGHTTCREIREQGIMTPILFLSVKTTTSTKIAALDAGADDHLAKPFDLAELLARLRALLRRTAPLQGTILTIDDLRLDTRTQKVTRAGREIRLTRKEFMLLEYFLRNVGAVLSRSALMEHAWDINADAFSNTLEAHICSLRRKIDRGHARKLIHTIPTRGYKIDVVTTASASR